MFDMVKRFPTQLEEAMKIGSNAKLTPLDFVPKLVFVAGMGGSGIGADFVASFIAAQAKIPYLVGKSYEAPAFIDKESLVIASSYSGNTEETLSAIDQILPTGARIICVASGGKLIALAKEKGLDYIQVPDNWASPRACLGYSTVAQLYILKHLGLWGHDFETELNQSIKILKEDTPQIQEKAKHLANTLFNKNTVIYSSDRIEPVAIRFRQQINENAKRLCWHHVIPEMNHNELVGWRKADPALAVIFLRNNDDHPRNELRIELTKEVVSHYAGTTIELYSKGHSLIERSLYLVHLLDYASVYLADLNKVDAIEVKVIDFLKTELSKVIS
jgi:glucose/mannose-6-phosphate isomerase